MIMNISDRLNLLIKEKGTSIRALEQTIGCSNGVLSRCINKNTDISSVWVSKIIETYKDVNPRWLLTGEGEMTTPAQPEKIILPSQSVDTRPRIPFEAAAGALSLATQSITESQCERFPLIPGFAKYDFTIIVRGDSMEPEFRSGDELACQMLRERGYIQWGRPYIIDSVDGVVLKRIHDAGDEILCTSDNPRYGDFKIPKNEINHLALIVGMIRKF